MLYLINSYYKLLQSNMKKSRYATITATLLSLAGPISAQERGLEVRTRVCNLGDGLPVAVVAKGKTPLYAILNDSELGFCHSSMGKPRKNNHFNNKRRYWRGHLKRFCKSRYPLLLGRTKSKAILGQKIYPNRKCLFITETRFYLHKYGWKTIYAWSSK